MIRCLVLIPYQPGRGDRWPTLARQLAERFVDANPDWKWTARIVPCDEPRYPEDRANDPHARVRNALIERYLLGPEGDPEAEYVLWIDSDLVDYPADFPTRAHAANPGGITAPCVVADTEPGRFYDVAGFVRMDGNPSTHAEPWFGERGRIIPPATEPTVDLLSVGCMYLAPAWLYRAGLRYEHRDGHVEHFAFCSAARERGVRVCCLTRAIAFHAWLPDHGEDWH